ncbi:helix-turn-helix transcriptional regulator [Catellatospora bangladeshensis]|uniref:Transcriptional regulator with XRE-family HTH domain n=1 Tax=Saccharothrix algeriensis TaxID=173560 RepID=A0ABS2SG22_9PSEU|nr:transcriptional regulator with XRE-family HTH domain [Saccharothrix algeriensis]
MIAGRAGISASHLSRLESGKRALDRRSLVIALADALEVAPIDLVGPTVVTPGEVEEDRALAAVRLALLEVSMDDPRGAVLPADVLKARVADLLSAQRDCEYGVVGEALPALIRDLHRTLGARRDEAAVLRLLPLFHVQGTQAWLMDVGASTDLGWHAVTLARKAADKLEDDPLAHAITAFGTAFGLMGGGALDLAAKELQVPEAQVGTASSEAMQVTGMLTLTSSLVSAAQNAHANRSAALDQATELAARTGEGNALWLGFGPSNVGVWRMSVALEAGDHAEAARIAATVDPAALPSPTRKSAYWREYGRALARLPRRHDEAVAMLRRAERISPVRIHRHPFMRSLLTELLSRVKTGAARRELTGMAYRAGLPV